MNYRLVVFAFSLLTGPIQAQSSPLQDFLEATRAYPSLAASQASLEAAEAALQEANSRVAVDADIGYTVQRGRPEDPRGLGEGGIIGSTGVSFRPVLFGPAAEAVRRRELDVQVALLAYQEALSGLERRALNAAWDASLAQEALTLAQEQLSLASQDLNAVRLRFEAGLINAQELRSAELAEQEARIRSQTAQAEASLADDTLSSLVGDVRLASSPELTLPEGQAVAVSRARIDIEYEQLGLNSLRRPFYPVARASYEVDIGVSTALVASFESDTLEPRIGLKYNDYGLDATGPRFQVSVGVNITAGMFDALRAAESRLETAQRSLAATLEEAALQEQGLQIAVTAAEQALSLAQQRLDSAKLSLSTAQERERLGLSLPLDTQRAALDLLQARFDLTSARLRKGQAILAFYELYALPLSEVLP